MKSTYSIIFYLKREKLKKDGTYPVMGRITVDGTQCQFSCKVDCKPDLWEAKGGRATGKSVMARNVNMELDKIKARIDKYYKEIVDRDNFVTAEKVKNAFLGLEYRQHTLMTMFAQWNEEYKKMYDGGLRSKASLHKYQAVYKHVERHRRLHPRRPEPEEGHGAQLQHLAPPPQGQNRRRQRQRRTRLDHHQVIQIFYHFQSASSHLGMVQISFIA